jgi:hypothetical protein
VHWSIHKGIALIDRSPATRVPAELPARSHGSPGQGDVTGRPGITSRDIAGSSSRALRSQLAATTAFRAGGARERVGVLVGAPSEAQVDERLDVPRVWRAVLHTPPEQRQKGTTWTHVRISRLCARSPFAGTATQTAACAVARTMARHWSSIHRLPPCHTSVRRTAVNRQHLGTHQ